MREWRQIKLKEVCERITVGYVGPMADQYADTGIPFLRSLNIGPFKLNLNNLKFISRGFHERIKKSTLLSGDVGIVRTGHPGTACVIPASLQESNCSDLVIVRPGKGLNPHFLAAIFNSSFGQGLVGGNLVGVAQQHFNITVAKELRLLMPPRAAQDKIAAILSAYDDLIANNQRRIALLESMAEEIYREWFVRMRFPAHSTKPFTKGWPIDWSSGAGSAFFNIVKGKSYEGDELTDNPDHMPFVSLKSFNRGGGYREDGLKRYSGRFRSDQVVRGGDVVMAVTDMTQNREVVGRVARMPDFGERGAVISLDVLKLEPTAVSKTFLYCFMRYSGFAHFIKEFANGANVLHLKPDLVGQQRIVLPSRVLQERFSILASPMLDEVDALASANQRLRALRDALLPRLISGQLKVDHLDIQLPPAMREKVTA